MKRLAIVLGSTLLVGLIVCLRVDRQAIGIDAALSKKIIGTWEGTQSREIGPATNIVATMIVRDDHTIESRMVVYFNDGKIIPVVSMGSWKIERGTLKGRMGNYPQIPDIDSPILELSDTTLVMQQRDTVATMHRKNREN